MFFFILGFGFINFKSPFSVNLCLKDSKNHFILGKWVECKKAKPSKGRKKHFIEKISYPTYESTNLKKQNIKLKNNYVLRSLNSNNFYKEPAYFNDNHILQNNLFVYQDNDFNQSDYNSDGIKEKNCEKNFEKNNNEIYSETKLQNFKNELKGKFNTINDEQNIMEIDTNSSSSYTNINSNYNKKNNSTFQRIKLNFNQNQKKSNNENFLIEENFENPYINSNNFYNKKSEIINETKKSLSYSMLPNNNEKQNPINEKDNWDLSKNITNSNKEMFQNYFNNLKDPQNYNYFHYKLFDVNGEDISNLTSYQNNTKINLFKNESSSKSDKDSDSNSGSNSNSNSNSNNSNSNKNKSSSTDNNSQKIKNNKLSSSDNQTLSKNSNSNKSNSQHSSNSCERSDSNSIKNSGSNSDSNSGNSGKNSNSNQNSGDSNQNSKESKTPSNNYKYKKHYKKSKSDSIIESLTSELINYNKDSE